MRPAYSPGPSVVRSSIEGKAIVALALGLLSLGILFFGPVAGIPAIILGALARRDIDRSRGTLGGNALAAGGIMAGLFGTGLGCVLTLGVIGSLLPDADGDAAERETAAELGTPVASGTRSYGTLRVVDLDEHRPLEAQLAEVTADMSAGRTVVLQTYVRSSGACRAVAAALPDRRMQRALADVTLVRVDVETYEDELREMSVETRTAPWFYKLDSSAKPVDSISGAAWDENIPENMAPILARFVQGSVHHLTK